MMDILTFTRFLPRFLWARFTGKRMPVQVHVRVIDKCNLRCSYCFGDYPARGIEPPTTQQLFDVLDGLGRLGTKRVTLTGGEPLLREDIHEVVLRARRNRIEPSLTTNGILIDRHRDLLKNLGQLTVSLDGEKEVHDTYRGEGSWEAAVHAVEVAREAGAPVQLLATVNRLSTTGLRDLFEVADHYNCQVTFDLAAPRYNEDGTVTVRPEAASDEKIRALLDSLIERDYPRAVFSPEVLKYLRSWPDSYAAYRLFQKELPAGFRPIPCTAGRFFAIIETDGAIYPCCRTGSEYSAPNVYQLGVEEAWRQMPPHDCAACVQVGANMFNALFALQPATLMHFLRREIAKK